MKRLLLYLNVVALALTILMNGLSESGFFPTTMSDAGESRAVFFLPAGYVFSIWGLIYLALVGFAYYQARHEEAREAVGWYFILSCAANIAWLILFLNNLVWLSMVAMLVLLFSLVMMYRRINATEKLDAARYWLLHFPFSVYLGWISVATVANFSAALHDAGYVTEFLGISADIWAAAMMIVTGVLALAFIFLRRDYVYALVIVWGLVGIYARPFAGDNFAPLRDLNVGLVHTTALGVSVLIALAVLLHFGRRLLQDRSPDTRPSTA